MKKTDLRTLTKEGREQLRRVAIRMFKKGRRKGLIAEELGIRAGTIGEWVNKYEDHGLKSVEEAQRGRPQGSGRIMTPEQELAIQKALLDKTPDQLKLRFALWNAQAVRLLIYQEFMIDLPVRTVRKYLARWGFTPQKALKRAYEQNPKQVKQWLDETFPQIKARAKTENAEIHWGDETHVSSVEHNARGYAPKGQTPILHLSQSKRAKFNLISAITNQGKVRFMSYNGSFTSQTMIRFLRRLIKDSTKKIFLVLDNLRVHHAKLVKAWVEDKKAKIELFFLPSYAPELNPDEYLNCDLKGKMNVGLPVKTEAELKSKLIGNLRSIQRNPKRVRSYFKAKGIKYAA